MKLVALRNDAICTLLSGSCKDFTHGLFTITRSARTKPCCSHALTWHKAMSAVECPLTPLWGSGMFPIWTISSAWREGMETQSLSPSGTMCQPALLESDLLIRIHCQLLPGEASSDWSKVYASDRYFPPQGNALTSCSTIRTRGKGISQPKAVIAF